MISVALQIIDFNTFHAGRWWFANFVLTSGACLSITERINLFKVSNWSSVSLNEYTVGNCNANGNVLKSFMLIFKIKLFQVSCEFITYFILVCQYVYDNVGSVVATYCRAG